LVSLWASVVDLFKGRLEAKFVSVGLTFVNQSLGVLEGVVIKLLALGLELVDQGSVAIVVLNLSGFSSSNDIHMLLSESGLENLVNFHSVIDFSLEGNVVL